MDTAPWFEDFAVGDEFNDVPAVTITDGHAAIHQSVFGDRMRLPLDLMLSRLVTGSERALVNPSLVCNLAIGQSTIPSQRVMGNLFYRGLVLHRPVFTGDTLTTRTRVVALRQNSKKEGRAASGMVALEVHVQNQLQETVMLFWRCPMIPCRDPNAETGRNDSFDIMPDQIPFDTLISAAPENWRLDLIASPDQPLGKAVVVEAGDTVTMATEIVRMTLNLAMAHTDATRSVYGKRLVYGGHTISIAAAQMSRVLTGMVTILGWYRCDHVAPVFEQDIIRSSVTLVERTKTPRGDIARVHVESFADRGPEAPDESVNVKVLDWDLAVLLPGSD